MTRLNTRFYYGAFAVLSAIALLAPIRAGDLPGYDDARYAHVAKGIAASGDWLNVQSNGYPDLEHPPLLEWMQAVCFSLFGVSDPMAKLPSALCGLGTILLVGWLGARLTGSSMQGILATFAMATTPYFLKYSARAMTDVPVAFFFVAAMCAWSLAGDDQRWLPVSGAFTALALLTRGLDGLALPVIFCIHLAIERRRPRMRYALPALAVMLLPPVLWYAWLIRVYGHWFFLVHSAWLDREVFGPLSPDWRRYTGIFEYTLMLARSYWPWLPFMIAGIVAVVRRRDRRLYILIVWTAVVAAMCAAARSRVLRYMLPAYPAFSILTAVGLARLVPFLYIRNGLRIVTPALAAAVLAIALYPPAARHAAEVRPIAVAATSITPRNGRIAFYDAGQPRFDETNQMQWYGGRNLFILLSPEELAKALSLRQTRVFVIDKGTYRASFGSLSAPEIVAESGHLICVRLAP